MFLYAVKYDGYMMKIVVKYQKEFQFIFSKQKKPYLAKLKERLSTYAGTISQYDISMTVYEMSKRG